MKSESTETNEPRETMAKKTEVAKAATSAPKPSMPKLSNADKMAIRWSALDEAQAFWAMKLENLEEVDPNLHISTILDTASYIERYIIEGRY